MTITARTMVTMMRVLLLSLYQNHLSTGIYMLLPRIYLHLDRSTRLDGFTACGRCREYIIIGQEVPTSTEVEDAREDAMDITLTAFPEEELATIAKWRSDGEVHRYLRHGYTTLAEVSTWYHNYFSSEANQLLGILVDNQLIGYCTIEHIDRENHKCEVGIVIG